MPQRASLRIKGLASDGHSVADELRNGQIVVKDSNQSSVWGPFPRYQDAPEIKPREMPTGTLLSILIPICTSKTCPTVLAPRLPVFSECPSQERRKMAGVRIMLTKQRPSAAVVLLRC